MSFAAVLERLNKLENPYPGLRYFETQESHLFFGRDQQIGELVGRLQRNRFVAVLGVSGGGKSSLVRAGLIPALERGRGWETGKRWHIVITRPAGAPFESLSADLEKQGIDATGLRDSSHGLIKIARQLPQDNCLLVVVDQFEELFRYKEQEPVTEEAKRKREALAGDAAEFVQLLLESSRSQPPIYIVLTMRSDYLGDCAEFRDLPETLNDCQYLVPRMTREQRKEAIEGPLGQVEIAPSLVQQMLNDVGDEPDQLPILQHALMRTWSQWRKSDPERKRNIESQDYEAIGGFENALNNHADELLEAEVVKANPRIPETIFKRLTARGRSNRERRDPATLAALWGVCGAETDEERKRVTDVLDHFRHGEATFLTPRSGELVAESYIDITHECLIRQWSKLRDVWLVEEGKSAKTFLNLVERSRSWKDRGGEILAGLDLVDAEKWSLESVPSTEWASHYANEVALHCVLEYIGASQLAERKRVARAKRNIWIAVGLPLTLAFAAAAVTAVYQRNRAELALLAAKSEFFNAVEEKNNAEKQRSIAIEAKANAEMQRKTAEELGVVSLVRQLTSQSELLQTGQQLDLEPAALLATESMLRIPSLENDHAIRESTKLLRPPISHLTHQDSVNAVALSADGRFVATGSDDKTARVFDAASGKEVSRLIHQDSVRTVAFSADGRFVATGSNDKTARVFDAASGKEVSRLIHQDSIRTVAFSTDGRFVATGSDDNSARVFDAASGKEVSRLVHQESVNVVAFSANGRFVATGSDDGTARVFDAASGKEVSRLAHEGSVKAVAYSSDGRFVATGSEDNTARVFDAASGKEVSRLVHQESVNAVAFSSDGRFVATGSDDGTARVFDAASGKEVSRLAHQGSVKTVTFSSDGRFVATGSLDNTARVFEAATGKEVGPPMTHHGSVNAVAFSADGRYLATGSNDNTARVFEARSERNIWRLTNQPIVFAFAFSADGRYLATGNVDSTARRFEATTGKEISRLTHQGFVGAITFSADGRYLATGSDDRTARVFESTTGKEVSRLTHKASVTAVAFSADGRYLATGSVDKTLRVFEAGTGKEISQVEQGDLVYALAFSADGRYLATCGKDNTSHVFEVATGKEISRLTHQGFVNAIAFSPDGRYLATGSADKKARLFEAMSGREILRLDLQASVSAVAFSSDGRFVATGSNDKTARLFEVTSGKEISRMIIGGPVTAIIFATQGRSLLAASVQAESREVVISRHLLRPQDLIEDACSHLTRNLTLGEWKQYVGIEIPYHKTCRNLQ